MSKSVKCDTNSHCSTLGTMAYSQLWAHIIEVTTTMEGVFAFPRHWPLASMSLYSLL